ncbi:hypothetical protein K6Y31_20670 [Motilimonas cestriensis]|uniref:Uncharacterized protein n=1 Tax=Motilimonas cestriensis TaxID=2742685 RepID=A0ABS8WHR5_9GAMM|nr:hypothetical protein [Motilimonas cestriensis]MCE2597191.1 hypothetical protein [Motilimonas cestriensis]
MIESLGTKVKGTFDISVQRGSGELEIISEDAENILLNSFFDLWLQATVPSTTHNISIYVGTGTEAPHVAQTTLGNFVSSAGANVTQPAGTHDAGTNIFTLKSIYVAEWATGSVLGNLTELGLSFGNLPNGEVHTRALIKDVGGNPTTLTLTATDKLIITYTLTFYLNLAPTSQVLNVNGTDHTFEINPMIYRYISLSTILGTPPSRCHAMYTAAKPVLASGIPSGAGGVGQVSRISDPINKVIKQKFTVPTGTGNYTNGLNLISFTDFSHSSFTANGPWFVWIDPPIPKTADQEFDIELSYPMARA